MMRLLLDQGLPRSTVAFLRKRGIEASNVGDIGLSRANDIDILGIAAKDGSIVFTLDADFHALLAVNELSSPSVIRIRIEGLNGLTLSEIIFKVLNACKEDLEKGAAISVQKDKIAVRLLPINK